MTVEECEVIVVGGGLAGLGAAYHLRGRDVLLLEAEDRLGGRIQSLQRGDYWLNLGAHIVNGDESLAARLAADFGLRLAHPTGSVTAISLNGRLVTGGRPELLPFRLSLPMAGRVSLIRVGLRLRRALARARAADPAALLGPHSDPADLGELPVDPQLGAISFADVLGPMHPDVAALMTTAARRSGGELNEISGHYGVISSLGAWDVRRPNLVGGTELLVDGLRTALGDRAQTGKTVLSVEQDLGGVRVEVQESTSTRHLHAAACVMAVPASAAAMIVRGLPDDKRAALRTVRYSPYVVAGMFTRESGPTPWDGIYAMAAPKRSICMLFNPANALRGKGKRQPGGSLVVYSASEPARRHLELSDSAIRDLFLADLADLFPGTNGLVDDVVIKRQPFGAPIPFPGRARLQSVLVRSCGRVAFAGDYLQYAGLDSALRSSLHAAREVETVLRSKSALGTK